MGPHIVANASDRFLVRMVGAARADLGVPERALVSKVTMLFLSSAKLRFLALTFLDVKAAGQVGSALQLIGAGGHDDREASLLQLAVAKRSLLRSNILSAAFVVFETAIHVSLSRTLHRMARNFSAYPQSSTFVTWCRRVHFVMIVRFTVLYAIIGQAINLVAVHSNRRELCQLDLQALLCVALPALGTLSNLTAWAEPF